MKEEIIIDKKEALALAEKLSVPSHSNGLEFVTMDRLDEIERQLAGTKYSHCVEDDIFRLYSQKKIEDIKGKILLISSHADCLQKEPVFKKESEKHPKRMIGIFDNAITNAACVYLMKYCDLSENVVFVFTGDEESTGETRDLLEKMNMTYRKNPSFLRKFRMAEGLVSDDKVDMMGAYAVCKFLKAKGKSFNTIALDCTYSAFEDKAAFTLENDFIYKKDKEWFDRIFACISNLDINWKFIPADMGQKSENEEDYIDVRKKMASLPDDCFCQDEEEDDGIEVALDDESYEYDERDISCISFCLPCDAEDMHVEEGFGIRRKNYYKYIKVLYILCGIEP